MKRTFGILLVVLAIGCAKTIYERVNNDVVKTFMTGVLSDIADEVIAIPLELPEGEFIEKVRSVRKEGNNLFLISNEVLYRFDKAGKFICRITNPEEIQVAGYVVYQTKRELIVLGNKDDIFYYSYDGVLLEKKKLKSDFQHHQMSSVALYRDRIWSMEEYASIDADTGSLRIEKAVVEYDTSFNKITTRSLSPVDLGRAQFAQVYPIPRLAVADHSGMLYAYVPSTTDEYLLQDTLSLKNRWEDATRDAWQEQMVSLFPFCLGSRFWIANYQQNGDQSLNYSYCYDFKNDISWQKSEGWRDDFYQTGMINDLDSIDIYNHSYCFFKTGKELETSFPDKENELQAVLFIVKIKQA
ncbi:6-bladed beta-propeller [Parabacteroides sp. PF5-9]|uniref:6-bladed beta-propeller n=1 Tax=Parabacteroides sp. PF5-9 TaxID=1742404 RepID=UPI0024748BA8|nr:6-bladed beta-propeller [Parabacteroides sp. PF5-9]MDH6357998.1 hypothetical protein [Parabacteroides sp. PF5-9]